MTRDEKIHEASFYKEDNLRRHGYNEIYIGAFTDGFYEGVSWTDSTPNWHKYPDEKPKKEENPEWSKTVLIAIQELDTPVKAQLHFPTKNNSFEYWYTLELGCHIDKEDVLAWMELPQPPKFD